MRGTAEEVNPLGRKHLICSSYRVVSTSTPQAHRTEPDVIASSDFLFGAKAEVSARSRRDGAHIPRSRCLTSCSAPDVGA